MRTGRLAGLASQQVCMARADAAGVPELCDAGRASSTSQTGRCVESQSISEPLLQGFKVLCSARINDSIFAQVG